MAYKILAPERKVFTLSETDARYGVEPDEPTKIEVRTATVRQNQERETMFADFIQETKEDGSVRRIVHLPVYELIARETFLTLTGCNITSNDSPVFRFKNTSSGQVLDMTYEQFKKAWGELPEDIALEIHKYVLEVNPHWKWTQDNADLGK